MPLLFMISSFFSPLLIFYHPLYISSTVSMFSALYAQFGAIFHYTTHGQESIPCGNHSFLELLRITQRPCSQNCMAYIQLENKISFVHHSSSRYAGTLYRQGKFVDVLGFYKTASFGLLSHMLDSYLHSIHQLHHSHRAS